MALEIDLKDKRALVTGVTSGVGLGIARMLAQAGCDVAGCGRSADDSAGARAFRDAVSGHARAPHYFRCDMTDARQVAGFAQQAVEVLGGLEVVVSNAGMNVFMGAADCTDDDWQMNAELNLASHWRLAKATRGALAANSEPGCLLIVTSNHAYQTIPGCFPYNVTKTALTGLVRALAIEWGPRIRVAGVAPGFIDTEGNHSWFESFPEPDTERRRCEMSHPAGRLGTPDEIGALCAFLASRWSGFITGTTVLADGGRSAVLQDGHPGSGSQPSHR